VLTTLGVLRACCRFCSGSAMLTVSSCLIGSVYVRIMFMNDLAICFSWRGLLPLTSWQLVIKQLCLLSLLSVENVCWPCRMLPPGESLWVCWWDRRTDARLFVTLHILIDATSVITLLLDVRADAGKLVNDDCDGQSIEVLLWGISVKRMKLKLRWRKTLAHIVFVQW